MISFAELTYIKECPEDDHSSKNMYTELNELVKNIRFANGKTESLILRDSDSDGVFNHTQVITLSDKKTKSLFTRQGNLHYRLLANSPGNWFYAGVPIEKTVWNFKGNYHYNFISGNKISNPMQSLNPSLFDWDFQKFNNYSVDSRGKGKIKGPADSVKSKSKSSTPPKDDIKKPE